MMEQKSKFPSFIIDAHLHVASTKYTPIQFIEGVISNSLVSIEARLGKKPDRNQLINLYLSQLQDHDCTALIKQMDDAKINQAVLLLPDYTFALKGSSLTIEEMFLEHQKILERHSERFYVFAGVDPRWGMDGLALFKKGLDEMGFSGMKIYPPCGYSPSDKMLYPFYEICNEYQVPVLLHIGGTSPALSLEYASPIFLEKAAQDFPGVNFILAHGSTAYTEECIMLCSSRPNVYLDISTYQKQPIGNLHRIFSVGINHKIIFGTDWPIFRLKSPQSSQLESLFSSESPMPGLDAYELENFFYKTIKRLIGNKKSS